MKSNLGPAERLLGDDGRPQQAENASRLPITTHDRAEHLTAVVANRRAHIAALEAADKAIGGTVAALQAAVKSAERLQVHDGVAATLLFELQRNQITSAIKRHQRELGALEAELITAKARG